MEAKINEERLKEYFDRYTFWKNIPNFKLHAESSLFIMESNVRRMKYMMELGWYCQEYSEEEWQKFKQYEIELRKRANYGKQY